ncbi:hypothetical protein KA405_00865 [Patescibacteria group bacterium]|nr:hypothetical protein [Patescibacteria group bacterium]
MVHTVEHEIEDMEESLENKYLIFRWIDALIDVTFPKKSSAYVSVFFISL